MNDENKILQKGFSKAWKKEVSIRSKEEIKIERRKMNQLIKEIAASDPTMIALIRQEHIVLSNIKKSVVKQLFNKIKQIKKDTAKKIPQEVRDELRNQFPFKIEESAK